MGPGAVSAHSHKNATSAGVWGLIGVAADVDTLKSLGPNADAAVVAYSSSALAAVHAESAQGIAVNATASTDASPTINATHTGKQNSSTAVMGSCNAGRGVAGFSQAWQGVYGFSASQAGVVGESNTFDGVFGLSHNLAAAGVSGHNPGGLAGYFDGNVTVTGNVSVVGDILLPGADCAEVFEVDSHEVDPGTVMVLTEGERLTPCRDPYDTRVAGVVSGADRYRPGLILNSDETAEKRRPIALIGRVSCKVDASYGAIGVGDILTTSSTPGHAMKAADSGKALGTSIGKALRAMPSGQGLIPVLVSLR